MATELAGQMYDRAMRRQHQPGGDCTGPDCFRYTFLICCALAAVGTMLAALLWRRTGKQYQTIIKVRAESEVGARAVSGGQMRCRGLFSQWRLGDNRMVMSCC